MKQAKQKMKFTKNNVRVSVIETSIEIKGKTFTFQINFDDITFLHIDHEQKTFAEEMEIELAKVERYYPELENMLRIVLHTPEISCVFSVNRKEGDKIARLNHERFRKIIISGTPRNFFEEQKKLVEELQNSDGTEEMSYPVHFHACGHSFGNEGEEDLFEFGD